VSRVSFKRLGLIATDPDHADNREVASMARELMRRRRADVAGPAPRKLATVEVAYERIRAALADVEVPPGLDKGHPCLDRIAALKHQLGGAKAAAAAFWADLQAAGVAAGQREDEYPLQAILRAIGERDALAARVAELERDRAIASLDRTAVLRELDAAEESVAAAMAVMPAYDPRRDEHCSCGGSASSYDTCAVHGG
jgi:hypothetical protein